jgi:leader peptidase (prepilin peptidase)/N-methyltransferase
MSYLWLKGLCSECHQPIGFRHFLVEVLMGVMGIYYLGCYPNIEGGVGFCFMALLLTGALVDWETFSLPAPLLGLGFLLGSVWVGFFSDNPISLTAYTSLTEGLLACVAVSGVLLWLGLCFEIIFKKPALGLGDVYWLGIIALFSGPLGAIFSLFFGAFLGLIFIMIAFLLEKLFKVRIGPRLPVDEVLKESFSVEEDRKVDLGLNIAVPFGPWLSLAAAIYFNFIQKYSLLFIEKLHFLIDHYHLLF